MILQYWERLQPLFQYFDQSLSAEIVHSPHLDLQMIHICLALFCPTVTAAGPSFQVQSLSSSFFTSNLKGFATPNNLQMTTSSRFVGNEGLEPPTL